MPDPSWHRYREAVIAFQPKACGRELELRCRIMSLRDYAIESLGRALPEVEPILSHCAQLGLFEASTASVERLPHVHMAMRDLYASAKRLQMGLAEK